MNEIVQYFGCIFVWKEHVILTQLFWGKVKMSLFCDETYLYLHYRQYEWVVNILVVWALAVSVLLRFISLALLFFCLTIDSATNSSELDMFSFLLSIDECPHWFLFTWDMSQFYCREKRWMAQTVLILVCLLQWTCKNSKAVYVYRWPDKILSYCTSSL